MISVIILFSVFVDVIVNAMSNAIFAYLKLPRLSTSKLLSLLS